MLIDSNVITVNSLTFQRLSKKDLKKPRLKLPKPLKPLLLLTMKKLIPTMRRPRNKLK